MTPALHRSGLARLQLTTHRQAAGGTWTAALPYSGLYPVTNLAVAGAGQYVTGPIPNLAPRVLLATWNAGSSIYIQTVQVLAVAGEDYNGSGVTVGVRVSLDDDTGTIFTENVHSYGNTASYQPGGTGRASRHLYLYGQQVTGYGSDPAGNYTTLAYFDCLEVTGEV